MRARMARRQSLCFFWDGVRGSYFFLVASFFSYHVVFFLFWDTSSASCDITYFRHLVFCLKRYSSICFSRPTSPYLPVFFCSTSIKGLLEYKCSKKRGDHDLLAMIFQATKKIQRVFIYQGVFCSRTISIDCDMTSGSDKTSGRSDRWRLDW